MDRNAPGRYLPAVAVSLCFAANLMLADGARPRSPLIPQLSIAPTFVDLTVPRNGDVNPYGVAFVPRDFPGGGPLNPGDIVVSNFNNSANLQGTGTTIVRVNNGRAPTAFFQGRPGLGLTTALGVLEGGFVLVGNLPSTDGSGICVAESGPSQNVGQGGLLVINKHGKLVQELTSATLLDGPWDLTVLDEGEEAKVFVSNALSGTVTRLDLRITGDGDGNQDGGVIVERQTQIASGYTHRCDPAAFVVGPTGLALDQDRDILYVSSTGDNAIFAIGNASNRSSDAGMGDAVVTDQAHLHGPLGLALAPNGDLISTQGDAINPDPNHPSEVVEFTRGGQFVAQFSVDAVPGSAFGLAIRSLDDDFIFATVDDNTAVLDVWVVE
jgi:hypothetical protein